jgi:hypothetical protein
MYFKFAILLFIISCTEIEEYSSLYKFESDDSYYLSWDGKSSKMKVNLVYTISSEITEFTFGNPDFGGQKDIIEVLKNIKWWIQPINATGSNSLSFWAKISLGVL